MNFLSLTETIEEKNTGNVWIFTLTTSGTNGERKITEHIFKEFLKRNCAYANAKWQAVFIVGDKDCDASTYGFHADISTNENFKSLIFKENFHVALLAVLSRQRWTLKEHSVGESTRWFFVQESMLSN